MFEHVMVAVGGRDETQRVLRPAAAIADKAGVPLELVRVKAPEGGPEDEELAFEMASLAHAAGVGDGDGGPELTVLEGYRVAHALIDHAEALDNPLVCMASSVHSRVDELLLGSTTAAVLRRITSPALVVGPAVTESPGVLEGPVVVCTDGSPHSESIMPLARDWVHLSGQQAWVVAELDPDGPVDLAHETAGVHQVAEHLGPGTEWEVLHGRDPAGGIVDFAGRVDAGLVILATHGRSALAQITLGSVALGVVHQAPCPVLVRRPVELDPAPDDD